MAIRPASASRAMLCLSLFGLAACGPSAEQAGNEADNAAALAAPNSSNAMTPPAPASPIGELSDAMPRSCAADIGAAAAEARVKICRAVSPATHPPCNATNSCAMIEEEIARSCALFDGKDEPMAECKPAPKSKEAAAAVVQRYYAAIDAHDYDTAWQQWGEHGPPKQTPESFRAGFAQTRTTRVTIGPLTPGEGGAGSIYQTVPVIVDATLNNGAQQQFRGDYVVRRVNDVDGASAAQLRWHIDSAKLTPVSQ